MWRTLLVWLATGYAVVHSLILYPDKGPPPIAPACHAIEFKVSENGKWYEVNCEGGAWLDKAGVIHLTPLDSGAVVHTHPEAP